MGEQTKIERGHADYDAIRACWIKNGRASRFDRIGAFGGQLLSCLDNGSEYPAFFVSASAGPPVFDDFSAGGPTQKGFQEVMPEAGGLNFRWNAVTNQVTVTKDDMPRS